MHVVSELGFGVLDISAGNCIVINARNDFLDHLALVLGDCTRRQKQQKRAPQGDSIPHPVVPLRIHSHHQIY
jgi:hypothetical protein